MITFRCTAKDGELDFGSDYNKARLHDYLISQEGKQLLLQKEETKRTMTQNNFYWVYLGIIEQETGNTAENLHEFFKTKLLPKKLITIHGKQGEHELSINKSTTELNKVEFGEYLEKICALTQVPLPDPEALGYIRN